MNTPHIDILKKLVAQEMCTGCGACAAQCPKGTIPMNWNDKGFLVPSFDQAARIPKTSLQVCPFNPIPEPQVRTENELAALFLKEAPHAHPQTGRYFATYAGYAVNYRKTSSSGGIASYLMTTLLESKTVDAVLAVRSSEDATKHYEYAILRSTEEVLSSSKTKYYPVTLADVLRMLPEIEGKVAIVGIACFLKAVRLHQYYHPELRDKIAFLIGIICGGMKSSFFAEYLAGKAGADIHHFRHPQFRIKNTESFALDYSYGCMDADGKEHTIKMRSVGDMWGTGLFKNNACDFCDDVTTELADISLGDAWLEPYSKDGHGTNVLVTRSQLAESLITKGIKSGALVIDNLSFNAFLSSQQGSFNHRHTALGYRVKLARKRKKLVPPKRHEQISIPIEVKWVQKQRMKTRSESLRIWKQKQDSVLFDKEINKRLYWLGKFTALYHYARRFRNLINRNKK